MTNNTSKAKEPLRIISITGGKGGIGKTTISVNLAIAFAKAKKRVLLLDTDLSLANIDVMLGLTPKKNLYDFILGHCELDDVCMTGPHNIKIIPGASGIQKMADLTTSETSNLIHAISSINDEFDVMLVDTAAGISKQVINFTQASQDIIVVVCNDHTSLVDSYAMIKILNQSCARNRFGIVINRVNSMQEGFQIFNKFQQVASRFINISLNYLGYIPADDYIGMAARERVSVIDKYPHSAAAIAFKNLSHGISHWRTDDQITSGIQFMFERLLSNHLQKEDDLCKV